MTPRRILATVLFACATLILSGPAKAQEPTADKDGWWNRLSSSDGGLGGLPISPPSTVPSDAFAVGLSRGEPDKVAALGVGLTIPADERLDELFLFLTESGTPGAQIRADEAAVFACPATSFWGAEHNGPWDSRPASDCSLGRADGVRNSDGGWTFDLTGFGVAWTTGALDPNGVVFAVDADASADDVQVSFLDTSTGEVEFFMTTTQEPASTPTPAPTPAPPPPPPPPAAPVVTPAPAPSPPPTPEPTPIVTQPTTSQGEVGGPNVVGNQPVVVWFGLPLLVAVTLVTSYVLGPAGRPDPAGERRGPIGRALDDRTPGEGR